MRKEKKVKGEFSKTNERLFSSVEISSIGTVGTLRLLRGGVARFFSFITRSLAYTSVRSYGCFFLSFGILSLLLNLGEYYFTAEPEVPLSALVISMALALLSAPLILFDSPMSIAVQNFSLTDKLFFEFFAIKRMRRNATHASISPLFAIFLGFIPAAVGFFVPLEWVLLIISVAVIVTVSFTSPEFPMILTLLVLPYLQIIESSVLILCLLSALTFISYALKVVVGKRVFNLDLYSVSILLIMALAFFSGLFGLGYDSHRNSLVFIALLFAYFPAANMIINRRLADCAMSAVIASAVPVSVISIIEFIVEHSKTPFTPPAYSTPGISAFFVSPTALLAFMLVSATFTLGFAIQKSKRAERIFYILIFFLENAVCILVAPPFGWIAAILGFVAYHIIRSRRIPVGITAFIVVLAHLVFLIPGSVLSSVTDYLGVSSLSDKLAEFKEALRIFSDNSFFGVGIGENSYIAAGADASGVSNTLLSIAVQEGVFVLVLFLILLLMRFRHFSYYRKYVRTSPMRIAGEFTLLSLVVLLTLGAFENIFADESVLYLFFAVFGICASALREAKREYDNRLAYYGDSRSSKSSELDVGINN